MKVLFITPAPLGISPGQRFRFEHYLTSLEAQNINLVIKPFFTLAEWKLIYKKGSTPKKFLALIAGLLKRIGLLFTVLQYDIIYIYRETLPFGPPVFEWIIAKLFRKKIIYDFDDAIWIPTTSTANPIAAKIKCTWKVGSICKWSNVVTVGNQFLANYAKQFCSDVKIIPTVVDTEASHNTIKNQEEKPLTIGWTGTFTNFIHLPLVIPAIKKLHEKYIFNFLIIADHDPELKDINYIYCKWNKTTEIADLLKMHIGIMPLLNTDIQLGKCAFKAIQYMSLGIPAVVSPVGANCEVVINNINGYWADNDAEWFYALEKLLINAGERFDMGKLAKATIAEKYSVTATKSMFIQLFQK